MRALRLAILALCLTLQCFGPAHAGPGRFRTVQHHVVEQITPVGSPVVYDTRFGTGNVTANGTPGWFTFTPSGGVPIYWVDSSSGSDSNNCTAAATPCGTIDGVFTKATASPVAGTHIRVAGTGGRTYTQSAAGSLIRMSDLGGISETYPTVVESYDPADPTNAAKYGKLVGANMPVIIVAGTRFSNSVCGLGSYIAFQGLAFDGNDGDSAGITWQCGPHTGIAWQNVRVKDLQLTIEGAITYDASGASYLQDYNFSKSSFIGAWASQANMQPLYVHATNNTYLQDNVFWHGGWRLGDTRNDPGIIGGPAGTNHAHYVAAANKGLVVSRNTYADSSFDGLNVRGNSTITSIASLDEPTVGNIGAFSGTYREAPDGISEHLDDWLMTGSSPLNAGTGGGYGPQTTNTLAGSYIRNVAAFDNPSPKPFLSLDNPYVDVPTSITHSGTTATLTLTGHSFIAGGRISVYGASPSDYNVVNVPVTIIDANTVTYTMATTPATNATAVGQTTPLVPIFLTIDKVHSYNYSSAWSTAKAGRTDTFTNIISDQLAPGGGNSVSSSGTFAGYQTRDQVITAVLNGVGITPGATYFIRKGQFLNAALARPDLPWSQWLIGVGFPAMGLTPTYTTPAYQTFTDTPMTFYKTTLTDVTLSTTSFTRGTGAVAVISGLSALPVVSSSDLPAGFSIDPVTTFKVGTLTSGSNQLTSLSSTTTITPGMYVSAFSYLTVGTYVVSISGTTATLSQNAIGTGTVNVQFSGGGRALRYDGSGTGAATPTIHITENSQDGTATPHTTPIALTISFLPLFGFRRRKKAENDNEQMEMAA